MTLRPVLFWTHLTAGALAGALILVMSLTGVALAMKPQIQAWIERDVRHVTPQATTRLGAGSLLAAVKTARPDAEPQTVTVSRDPAAAAVVNLGRDGSLYVNPYSGVVLGSGSTMTNAVFQSLTSWHRYLGASGDSRAIGRSATGAGNAAFLLLALTGLYIWWPKQLTPQHFRAIVWFRSAATSRARDFNWHNTIGVWCLIPIVIMTASGVVMSYPWANALVYGLTGSPVPVRAAAPVNPAATNEARTAPPRGDGDESASPRSQRRDGRLPGAADIDRLWARAEQQVPTWSLLSVRVPTREAAPIAFTITDGAQWNEFARSTLTLNSASGELIDWQPYDRNSRGQKLRGWLRFAHTGELGGLVGQVIAGLGCLGGVFLVYTGLMLAIRRLLNWLSVLMQKTRRLRRAA